MRSSRRILLATAAVVSALVAGCSSAQKGQPVKVAGGAKWDAHYNNIHELTAHSDLAAAGSFTAVAGHSAGNAPATDFTFTISRVLSDKLKKESVGATITIHQTGGTMADGSPVEASDDPLFKVGENSVLFLHEISPGHFYVIGGPNGRFGLPAQSVNSGSSTVKPANDETVQFNGTIDQLASEVAKP
jgi:outer membrane murein-binding lipoprotein Lpp